MLPLAERSGPARTPWLIAAALVVSLGLLATIWSLPTSTDPVPGPDQLRGLPEFRPVIAVLPFSQSAEGAGAGLADGLTEDVLTDLSRLSTVDVIAAHTLGLLAGDGMGVEQMYRDFGITHVLVGNVRGEDQDVRVNARLVDASSGDPEPSKRPRCSPAS